MIDTADMLTICRTTYTRVLRTKSLYLLLASVLCLVGAAHLYTDLTCGRQKELMYDSGAALITLVGLLSGLMVTFDIARDLREKVALVLLSKPLGRAHYLLGKFFGVAYLVTINIALVTVGIMAILHWEFGGWKWDFLQVALSTWGSMIMVTALGVLFASFLTELPAALLTLVVFVLGHSWEFLARTGAGIGKILFCVLPNFCLLDFKSELGNTIGVSWGVVLMAVVYALVYSIALLSLSTILFSKRDLA
ncbi:MAG: ABC transporter permease subunit [Verrucomicrobiae bacterium]|nr:ABC transporter permease subunit [Verrucomicrobiae bacterium]